MEILIKEIMTLLPHRYPLLLVDRVTNYSISKKWLDTLKNVSINEPFFQGHFPTIPVMPGVLILEGMAQSAGILGTLLLTENTGSTPIIGYVTGFDKVKFRKPVIPGDQLLYHVKFNKERRGIAKFSVTAHVEDALASSAEITITQAP